LEPVTHFMTGAMLSRAGLNRRTAWATAAATLAAEAADLDVFWSMWSPASSLRLHRGITHTLWALPFVAGLVVGVLWLLEKALARWRRNRKAPMVPVRWRWVALAAFLGACSHLLLDWTNNYGVRVLYPFDPTWHAGNLVFIAEPLEWAVLFAALLIPALLGLVEGEIGAKRSKPRGQLWAIAALCGLACIIELRFAEHRRAGHLIEQTEVANEPLRRFDLEPYPVNPFRWHLVGETASNYVLGEVNTLSGQVESDPRADVIPKPTVTPATIAARKSDFGQAFLDWGRWAVVRDMGQTVIPGQDPPQLPKLRHWTTVSFTDLRFSYSFLGPGREDIRTRALGRSMYVLDTGEVLEPVRGK